MWPFDRSRPVRRGFAGNPKLISLVVVGVLLAAGCGDDSPTAPTTPPAPPPPVAEPTTAETWEGTLPVGGSVFYSFSVAQNGTVNLTITAVSGALVPSDVELGLGIGTPRGTECVTTTSVNTRAGTDVQLTGTFPPGVTCAKVSDIGNLPGPATFTMRIEYP